MSLALNSLPCAQQQDDNGTALQMVVVTNQVRPDFVDTIPVNVMTDRLAAKNVVLTSLIRYPMRATATHRALGMRSDGSVIAPTRQRLLGNSTLVETAERLQLETDYVALARRSGGSVFDLDMLRVESATDVLLNDLLVSQISNQTVLQLTSTCSLCTCNNGAAACTSIASTVRQYCLQPVGKGYEYFPHMIEQAVLA